MTAIQQKEYDKGVLSFQNGEPYSNPWGRGNLMEMCAYSAGYFDAQRRMV